MTGNHILDEPKPFLLTVKLYLTFPFNTNISINY